jgi:hypothetical protein
MLGSGDKPPAHGQFDKVRLLASRDVIYGKPQFVMHQVQEGHGAGTLPWANTPLLSRDKGQHLVVFRSRDTRHIGASQQGYGISGHVMVQDAFDREGRLRTRPEKDALDAGAAGSVRGYPCAEHDGAVYVYWGQDDDALRVADGMRAGDGVNVPVKKTRPSLSGRLADASKTLVSDQMRHLAQTDHSSSPHRPHAQSLALSDLHLPPLPPAASPARHHAHSPARASPAPAHASTGAHGAHPSSSSPATRHPVTVERLSRAVARRLGTPSRTLPLVARTLGFERGAAHEYREDLEDEEDHAGVARLGTPAGRRTLLSRQVHSSSSHLTECIC